MNSRNKPKWWNITCIVRDCHSYVESCNFTNTANLHTSEEEIHTRPKLCHFGLYVVRATLFCLKSFVSVTGLECSYGKIFIPFTEMSGAKTKISVIGQPGLSYEHIDIFTKKRMARRDLGDRASPVDRAHMKRPLLRKRTSLNKEVFMKWRADGLMVSALVPRSKHSSPGPASRRSPAKGFRTQKAVA